MKDKSQIKKQKQLGMNPSTASHRLVKDILFDQLSKLGLNKCFQCGKSMTRDDFSIEHKEPWLDSDDPLYNYFDLDNISFSHHKCNMAAARSHTHDQCSSVIKRRIHSPDGYAWRNSCKDHLPESEFAKNSSAHNGLQNQCKKCHAKIRRR